MRDSSGGRKAFLRKVGHIELFLLVSPARIASVIGDVEHVFVGALRNNCRFLLTVTERQ